MAYGGFAVSLPRGSALVEMLVEAYEAWERSGESHSATRLSAIEACVEKWGDQLGIPADRDRRAEMEAILDELHHALPSDKITISDLRMFAPPGAGDVPVSDPSPRLAVIVDQQLQIARIMTEAHDREGTYGAVVRYAQQEHPRQLIAVELLTSAASGPQ